jgi:hypothetical protein
MCLLAVGAGLAVQGGLTVLFLLWSGSAANATHGLLNHDARHGLLHVVWGIALLNVLWFEHQVQRQISALLIFGSVYIAFGVLGVVVHNPFGFMLGTGENGFHFIVGFSALAVGVLGRRSIAGQLSRGIAQGA